MEPGAGWEAAAGPPPAPVAALWLGLVPRGAPGLEAGAADPGAGSGAGSVAGAVSSAPTVVAVVGDECRSKDVDVGRRAPASPAFARVPTYTAVPATTMATTPTTAATSEPTLTVDGGGGDGRYGGGGVGDRLVDHRCEELLAVAGRNLDRFYELGLEALVRLEALVGIEPFGVRELLDPHVLRWIVR